MKNLYHYTKGYKVGAILFGQEILALAMSQASMPDERLVWLTREETYPRTALPGIPEFPETLMANQLKKRHPVDLLKVAAQVGGIWRFAFDATKHPQIKAWLGSYQRSKLIKTPYGKVLESTAQKVGDHVELWAIASSRLSIVGSTLQQLTPQGWVDRVSFFKVEGELMVEEVSGACAKKIMTDSFALRKVLFG